MRTRALLQALVVALDVLAVVAGLRAAHAIWAWWRPYLDRPIHLRWWELWWHTPFMPSGLALLVAWILVLRQMGLYDPARMTSSNRIAVALSRASAVLLIVVMMLQFLLPDRTYSRLLILSFCGFTSLFMIGLRLLFFRVQARLPRSTAPTPVAIVGVGEDAAEMGRRLERFGHAGFRLAGYVRPSRDPSTPDPAIAAGVVGDVADLARLVNRHDLRVLVLATRFIHREDALVLATRADQMGLRVLQVPFTWGVASPRVEVAPLGDLQLIDLTTLAYPSLAEQLKRLLDLVVVGLGGLLLSPLMALTALAIRLQDRGPVLFVQERAGKGGRKFPFFKFRSMVVGAEDQRAVLDGRNEADGVLFKIARDPRVTPVGRFIRKYSIDELPQLWNVLRGDMNLVGPRPLPMSDLAGIGDDPEVAYWFELRCKVKPGITGPWQVSGRSGLGFKEMVQHDIAYIQSWSLWLDLLILLRTVPAVLRGRGAH